MFDTHCHLNFQVFAGRVDEIIKSANDSGVNNIVIPGTNLETSKRAVEIAGGFSSERSRGIYAAVGIHPHHVFELLKESAAGQFLSHKSFISASRNSLESEKNVFASNLKAIENLLKNKKVVAVGEIGIDCHLYRKTKYKDYKIDEKFVELQKELFIKQIKLAYKYKKALIIHNREAKKEVLQILTNHQSLIANFSSIFHCCEPDLELLDFAKKHKMFIGVDGDVVYWKEKLFGFAQSKQEFIKKVPLKMLVLETDSPYLSPFRKFPNEPKNITYIAEFVAKLKNISLRKVKEKTTENAKKLFKLP